MHFFDLTAVGSLLRYCIHSAPVQGCNRHSLPNNAIWFLWTLSTMFIYFTYFNSAEYSAEVRCPQGCSKQILPTIAILLPRLFTFCYFAAK